MAKPIVVKGYSPLYFLSALGPGGLSVSFFMYLMFVLPHPETPMPNFSYLSTWLSHSPWYISTLTAFSLMGVVYFAMLHFWRLGRNLTRFFVFKSTQEYRELANSPAGIQLMAIPLTLAMSINVSFILGSLFVPGMWSVIEIMFPLAIVAFGTVGFLALRYFLNFMSARMVEGGYDGESNNNLSQMLSIFTFVMVAVGFAAPAAMSHVITTSALAFILSVFFLSTALMLSIIKMVIGFRSMFRHGIDKQSSVSLWIVVPILTLLGITFYRLSMALKHNFGANVLPSDHFILTTVIFSLMGFFGALGYVVMKRHNYFANFLHGKETHVSSYALVCPGVATLVFSNFFVAYGLVANGIITKHGLAYFILYAAIIGLQVKTIATLFRLDKKLLRRGAPALNSKLEEVST